VSLAGAEGNGTGVAKVIGADDGEALADCVEFDVQPVGAIATATKMIAPIESASTDLRAGGMLRRIGQMVLRLALICAFMSVSTSYAAPVSPSPVREVTIRQGTELVTSLETPRVVLASTIASGNGTIPFRPVDASLLEAVAVSKRGQIWIAPIRNGAQTSGTSERVVMFDPHTSRMSAFKIGRLVSEVASVVPAPDGGAWASFSHLPAVRRSFPDGVSEIFVAPSSDDETDALAVGPSDVAIVSEPQKSTIGRIAGATGVWTVRDGRSTSVASKSAVDDAGDVAFAEDSIPETIVRRMADGSVTRISEPSLGGVGRIDFDSAGDLWFLGDGSTFGELPAGSDVPSLWRMPGYLATLAPGSDGRAWLLSPPRLISFDARTSTGTTVLDVSRDASGISADGEGGVWVQDPAGLTHLGAASATAYTISGVSQQGPIAGSSGRVCFTIEFGFFVGREWTGGIPACLSTSQNVVTVYTDRFAPGINGVIADGDDMWLREKGRVTLVNANLAIPRFVYPSMPTGPTGMVALPDHSIWFAGAGLIQRLTSTSGPQTFRLTYPGNGPFGLAPDGHGGVLFAIGHAVGDISVDARGYEHLRYIDTGLTSSPEAVVAAPGGTIWCTDTGGWVLRIAHSGVVQRYRVPTSPSEPFGIALGPDKAIWFTEFFGGKIGRLDPVTGTIHEYPIPYSQSFPAGITAGAHELWFLDLNDDVGRVTTAGKVTEYPILAQSPVGY
jgi:streptogramin lyase